MWLRVVLLAAIIGAVVFLLWPRPVFVVRIRGGKPELVRGRAPSGFLSAAGDLASRHGVVEGAIRGHRKANHISLSFSRSIPRVMHQPLRNLWAVHG